MKKKTREINVSQSLKPKQSQIILWQKNSGDLEKSENNHCVIICYRYWIDSLFAGSSLPGASPLIPPSCRWQQQPNNVKFGLTSFSPISLEDKGRLAFALGQLKSASYREYSKYVFRARHRTQV